MHGAADLWTHKAGVCPTSGKKRTLLGNHRDSQSVAASVGRIAVHHMQALGIFRTLTHASPQEFTKLWSGAAAQMTSEATGGVAVDSSRSTIKFLSSSCEGSHSLPWALSTDARLLSAVRVFG